MTGERSAELFLGVDGGGTKTALCLVTGDGTLAAELRAPSVYSFGAATQLVTEVLVPAVRDVCARAGCGPDEIRYAFFGLPGYGESSADQPALDRAPHTSLGHDRYRCGNDMVCGWAGSLAGADGINVVSGTGSIAYGERAGRQARVGGWGELFGDEGSAYWIAVQGLNVFSRMSDGRQAPGPLHAVLSEHLGLSTDLDLVDVVLNRWGGRRSAIAALAPVVVRAADAGDQDAAAILDAAAAELAGLVFGTRDRLGYRPDEPVSVSWSGGAFAAERLRTAFRRQVLARHPHDRLTEPRLTPVLGAALYAARLAGRPLVDAAVARLAAQQPARSIP